MTAQRKMLALPKRVGPPLLARMKRFAALSKNAPGLRSPLRLKGVPERQPTLRPRGAQAQRFASAGNSFVTQSSLATRSSSVARIPLAKRLVPPKRTAGNTFGQPLNKHAYAVCVSEGL